MGSKKSIKDDYTIISGELMIGKEKFKIKSKEITEPVNKKFAVQWVKTERDKICSDLEIDNIKVRINRVMFKTTIDLVIYTDH